MFKFKDNGKIFPAFSGLMINITEGKVFLLAQLRLHFVFTTRAVFRVYLGHSFLKWSFFLADTMINCGKMFSKREY